jgi:hypothetical protein
MPRTVPTPKSRSTNLVDFLADAMHSCHLNGIPSRTGGGARPESAPVLGREQRRRAAGTGAGARRRAGRRRQQ